MKITTLTGLIANATLSPSHSTGDEVVNDTDRFQLDFLNELYGELRFYYHQSKKGSAMAEERVTGALKGLAQSIRNSDQNLFQRFFDSLTNDEECTWFLISSFTNYPGTDPDYFTHTLLTHLSRSNLLSEPFKAALKRSQATTLATLIEKVFPQATLAVQLALLEILYQRGEWNETWLNHLLSNGDPIIQNKLKTFKFQTGSTTFANP